MIHYREYVSYDDYVEQQGEKIRRGAIVSNQMLKFISRFKRYYTHHMLPGRVLCLGARTGDEVRAMMRCGFKDSVGLDLYPLGANVIKGDWHNLPFEVGSFENVYTNSLDHCLDFNKMMLEVRRVLVPWGVFIFETWIHYALDSRLKGDDIDIEAVRTGEIDRHPFNAMFWDSISDVVDAVIANGFQLAHSFVEEPKWCGYILQRVS